MLYTFDWATTNLLFDLASFVGIVVGFVAIYFVSVRRLNRGEALIVSAIFSLVLVLGIFLFFFGPPFGWVGVGALLGILFVSLVVYSMGESEDPRLKERYQDGF